MAVVSVVGGVAEPGGNGIGSLNESSLHRDVKAWYAQPGDLLEAQVDGYVIDLVRGDLLVEVQTGSFASIRGKLGDLLTDHPVRLDLSVAGAPVDHARLTGDRRDPGAEAFAQAGPRHRRVRRS